MRRTVMLSAFILVGVLTSSLFSHCQIPCGIYDDEARFTAMLEDTTTLKKCVHSIQHLSKETPPDYNQLVRWVDTKETHADKISQRVLTYFLAQRIIDMAR